MGDHWVPQTYLRHFCTSKNHINVYDKEKKRKLVNQNIENYATEKNFYSLDRYQNIYNDKKYFEKVLSDLEGKTHSVFENLFKRYAVYNYLNNIDIFTCDEKAILSTFISLQFARTKKIRELLKDQILKPRFACDEERIYCLMETMSAGSREQETKEYHIQATILVSKFIAADLYNGKWLLKINTSGLDFITSDAPILAYDFKQNIRKFGDSFSNANAKIVFPLSPKFMLEINGPNNKEISKNGFVNDIEYVQHYNKAQEDNAWKYVFSKDEYR